MAIAKDGGTAFPRPYMANTIGRQGMSLRDYFAASAMEMMGRWSHMHQGSFGDIAKDAYRMADAMLKVREQ